MFHSFICPFSTAGNTSTLCWWSPHLGSPHGCPPLQRQYPSCYSTLMLPPHLLPAESGCGFCFSEPHRLYSLQWFVRLRGSVCCSPLRQRQCLVTPPSTTTASSALQFTSSFFLPPSQWHRWCIRLISGLWWATRVLSASECLLALAVFKVCFFCPPCLVDECCCSLPLPPLCLGKLVLWLLVFFCPFVGLVRRS